MKDRKFSVKVKTAIELTIEDIDDIMVGALEGGITYWADRADVVEEKRCGEWGHEQIARGGSLMIHDFESDKTHELNLENFLSGFRTWVEKGYDYYGAVTKGKVDCFHIDGYCADAIVQCALFGDVIYG